MYCHADGSPYLKRSLKGWIRYYRKRLSKHFGPIRPGSELDMYTKAMAGITVTTQDVFDDLVSQFSPTSVSERVLNARCGGVGDQREG